MTALLDDLLLHRLRPQTPAYDGATVTSPDPVLRKLADTVDVHFDYQGSPAA